MFRTYKRQPIIEVRFSQLKREFAVAPMYLKDISRIQGLLTVYFFALLVQILLEREIRQATEGQQISAPPLYPEGREPNPEDVNTCQLEASEIVFG